MNKISKNNLKISSSLFDFINNEALPGTNLEPDKFWYKFDQAAHELAPINKHLIDKREHIQKKIDNWHKLKKGKDLNQEEYTIFLKSIGYIVKEGKDG